MNRKFVVLMLLVALAFAFSLYSTQAARCAQAQVNIDETQPNANAVSFATQTNPMTLVLDARQAARGIMFARLTIPVRSGPFTLVYPKWIPGEHGPTGPLSNMAMLQISANGSTLKWQRDLVNLYAFHLDVPPGVESINVDTDVLLNGPEDKKSTANLAIVNWNRDLLYQNDTNSQDVFVKPSILLPTGWDFGSALPNPRRSGGRVDFDEVNLTTLVDSPLDCGTTSTSSFGPATEQPPSSMSSLTVPKT